MLTPLLGPRPSHPPSQILPLPLSKPNSSALFPATQPQLKPPTSGNSPTHFRSKLIKKTSLFRSTPLLKKSFTPPFNSYPPTIQNLSRDRESNPGPRSYHDRALPTELSRPIAMLKVESYLYCAGGGIRTPVGLSQRIYSPPPLTAWVPQHTLQF